MQLVAAELAWKVPARQLTQLSAVDAPLDANEVPAAHAVHDPDPALNEYRPAAQAKHDVALAVATNFPAAQLEHMPAPIEE